MQIYTICVVNKFILIEKAYAMYLFVYLLFSCFMSIVLNNFFIWNKSTVHRTKSCCYTVFCCLDYFKFKENDLKKYDLTHLLIIIN